MNVICCVLIDNNFTKNFLATHYLYCMVWYRLKSFITYYLRAITKYNIQSNFLFDFVSNVLDTEKSYYKFEEIENQRKRLLKMNKTVKISDYGAGLSNDNSKAKNISDIAKKSLSGKTKCRILFNIALYYRLSNIVELGTSLGISSSYLGATSKKTNVITLDGDKSLLVLAKEIHEILGLKNIQIYEGQFSKTLKPVLDSLNSIDMAFIDGNHHKKPTLEYFELLADKCHNNSIIVVDDIYWSSEMQEAWKKIIARSEVTLTIDLFDIGIVFFRKELSKQNITLIPYHFKPWKIGLFA